MDPAITSSSNPVVKRFRKLHRARGRRETGFTLLEGPTLFALAADAGVIPEAVLMGESDEATQVLCAERGWEPVLVLADVLGRAAESIHPQSPVVMIAIPPPSPMRTRDTLILRDVSDPGNVGTMIRSAAAFGWDVCISGASVDPWSPKVIRAGAGAHFALQISSSHDPISDARNLGLETVATIVSDGLDPARGEQPVALLIGSENSGLSPEDIGRADRTLTLPMSGETESLNAAVAASIAMYALGQL